MLNLIVHKVADWASNCYITTDNGSDAINKQTKILVCDLFQLAGGYGQSFTEINKRKEKLAAVTLFNK
jgi:hypothetical protein